MLRRVVFALLAVFVVGGAAVWHWRMTLLLPVPGMIDRWRDPIGAPKQFMRLVSYLQRNDPIPSTYFADREAEVPPIQQQGLPAQEITIAQLLRDRGYHTIGLGKWHLGEAPGMRPTERGFDEYLGF